MLSWTATLVVARLLTPGDYGIFGLASVFLGLVGLLTEFGLGTGVLTLRDLAQDQQRQIHSLSIGLGAVAAFLTCVLAVPLGDFFRASELAGALLVMSSTFIISAFRVVPMAVLQRDLRFRAVACIESCQSLIVIVTTVSLAVLGLRYWALVVGNVLSQVVGTSLALWIHPQRSEWPRLARLGSVVRFSWHVMVARLAWYAYSSGDVMIVGRVLGQAAVGAYQMAFSIATLPMDKVTNVVTAVTPAIFSVRQKEGAEIHRYLLGLTQCLAMVTLPASLGLALVASDFVALALGTKWQAAVVPLQLFAIYTSFRSLSALLAPVLIARGETRFTMWSHVGTAVVMLYAFYLGSKWDTTGIAAVWVVVYPILTLPLYWKVFRSIGLRLEEYAGSIWPAVHGSLLMVPMVLVVKWAAPTLWPVWAKLGAEVIAGAIAYSAVILFFHRERVASVVEMVWLLKGSAPSRTG